MGCHVYRVSNRGSRTTKPAPPEHCSEGGPHSPSAAPVLRTATGRLPRIGPKSRPRGWLLFSRYGVAGSPAMRVCHGPRCGGRDDEGGAVPSASLRTANRSLLRQGWRLGGVSLIGPPRPFSPPPVCPASGPRFRAHCTREAEGASLQPVSQGVFRAGANRQRQQSRRCCFLSSHSITDYRGLSSFQELFQNYRANCDRDNSRPSSRACLRTAAPPRCCTNATGSENRYSADCG